MSADAVKRLNAALSGRYRIESELGEGGMATVYLADDLKHERKVALKVLKPELAAVVGAERFLAEIKTTANLQHPHILPLFDSGEADGFLFFVMPYVEGETLRARIDRDKQLPVDEALGIATAVAGALHAAHEQGVVHRDIKPGNILLSRGQPLVADFGIALAVSASGGGRLTETGLSLGTPFYMSPEQATGDQAVGPASDTFALACVLYEMLTGDPPYPGSTAQAVLGKIIQGLPVSATAIRRSVPANVDAAIRKALEKLPADRFSAAQDFAKALADPGFRHGEVVGAVGAAPSARWKVAAVTFAALFGVTSLALGWSALRPEPPAPVERFILDVGADVGELSPDGSSVLFRAVNDAGQGQLFVRRWESLTAVPIPGTEGPTADVAFSPSGDEVAFRQGQEVKVAPLSGGVVRRVADDANFEVGWQSDGFIYYTAGGRIVRRPAQGGAAQQVTRDAPDGIGHTRFRVLPGADVAVFTVWGTDGPSIEAMRISTGERRVLTPGAAAEPTSTGHLVFGFGGELLAATFDAESMELTSAPVPVLQGVHVAPGDRYGYNLSASGDLVYRAGSVSSELEFVWISRAGIETPLDPAGLNIPGPADLGWELSPDGGRIAYQRDVAGNLDIYVAELPSGPASRLTFDAATELRPHWTPDGAYVSFTSMGGDGATGSLWRKRADGTGTAELVFDGFDVNEGVWSPEGGWLVLMSAERQIFAIRPGVDSVAVPLLTAEGVTHNGPSVSRDGRWLAYNSDETGRSEIYVSPFPDVSSGRWQVSTSIGGAQSVWSRSGTELFYITGASPRTMLATEFVAEPTFSASSSRVLFELPDGYRITTTGGGDNQDVSIDDQAFLLARARRARDEQERPQVVLVRNFFEELKRLAPN